MNAYTKETHGFFVGKTHFHNFLITALLRGGIIDLLGTVMLLFSPLLILWHTAKGANIRGKCLMVNLFIIYTLVAMLNLAFGHDILDHLFIAMLAIGTVLMSEGENAVINIENQSQHD